MTAEVKKRKLLEALEKNMGLVSYACHSSGVSKWFYYEQYKKDEVFKRDVDEIQNAKLDMAEATLIKEIQSGNIIATIFFLKTKGRGRGYIEQHRHELANEEGKKLVIELKR